jgi:hypothetical protein
MRAMTRAERWTTVMSCPEGHEFVQIFFDRATLSRRLLDASSIPLFCPVCRRHRDATSEERGGLERTLCAGAAAPLRKSHPL